MIPQPQLVSPSRPLSGLWLGELPRVHLFPALGFAPSCPYQQRLLSSLATSWL